MNSTLASEAAPPALPEAEARAAEMEAVCEGAPSVGDCGVDSGSEMDAGSTGLPSVKEAGAGALLEATEDWRDGPFNADADAVPGHV